MRFTHTKLVFHTCSTYYEHCFLIALYFPCNLIHSGWFERGKRDRWWSRIRIFVYVGKVFQKSINIMLTDIGNKNQFRYFLDRRRVLFYKKFFSVFYQLLVYDQFLLFTRGKSSKVAWSFPYPKRRSLPIKTPPMRAVRFLIRGGRLPVWCRGVRRRGRVTLYLCGQISFPESLTGKSGRS